jgi:hypothetical protein
MNAPVCFALPAIIACVAALTVICLVLVGAW